MDRLKHFCLLVIKFGLGFDWLALLGGEGCCFGMEGFFFCVQMEFIQLNPN